MIDWVIFDGGDTVMRDFPHFSGPMATWPRVEVMPGILSALDALRGDYRLAVATNAAGSGAALVRRALARVGLDEYFDIVLTARDLGVAKPDPAFFDALLEVCEVLPHRAVMVGDNFRTDIVGAKHAGLRAVWYNPDGKTPPADTPIRPNAVITSLEELPAAIHRIDDQAGSAI